MRLPYSALPGQPAARVRFTAQQSRLDLAERAVNVRGAFRRRTAAPERVGRPAAALGDELMPSGATAFEAARVFRATALRARRPGRWSGRWNEPEDARDNRGMFHIVLVHPEIPPNTGNVIRLAANTGCSLHLIEPLGFSMEDKLLQRAGLDYHEYAQTRRYADWETFLREAAPARDRMFAFTTRGSQLLAEQRWQPGDWLVFGSETAGLPPTLRESFPESQRVRLPMRAGQRSLNLSNAVAVTVFDAWRQNGYEGASPA